MNDNVINNSGQYDNNSNKVEYIKLRPIIMKKRQKRSKNLSLGNDNNLKHFLSQFHKRKNTDIRENKQEEFTKYTEKLEHSMNGYQMSYSQEKKDDDEEEDDKLDKYINKKDREIIKRIHDLNNSYDNRIMSPRSKECNIKIEVNEMNYPNPIKSLGVIRNNRHIYNELSKNVISRQSESFNKQIEEIEQYHMKYGKKMPKIHITDLLLKDSLNIPLVNLSNKKKDVHLPTLQQKGKKDLKLFSYYKYPVKNFPEGREQFSICRKNSEIIITGGISSNMKFLPIWSLNIPKLEWEKISQNNPLENRYGHTALALNNKLYIFGGKTKYATSSILNGLEIYSFNSNTFSNNNNIGGERPENRKSHIAVFVGTQMLIHGGINETGKVLNDAYILNLNPLKWYKCVVDRICQWPKLFGHACSLVMPLNYLFNPRFNLYSFPENDIPNKKKLIKEKGLFIFGGKSKEEGGISNQLWILIMGKKPLEWIKPETKGKPPAPRYFHSMNYYERGNYLIIHGGRNDNVSDSSALNDTYLLNLENFEWIGVTLYSNLNNFNVLSRCGHQSVVFVDKLIILGGMNNNNYLGSSLLIVNLDFSYSHELKSNPEIELYELKRKNTTEARMRISDIKESLKLKQLGLINNINLPLIK